MYKKPIFFSILLILILNSVFSNSASAYTYGDPNKENVAEVYKEMLTQLNEDPPNFEKAEKNYDTVKKEIDMHMGPEPSKAILQAIEDKDAQLVIEDMEKLLVLNVARRLVNVENKFSEYDTSKKLLAKGFATYEALSPKIEAENPELNKELKSKFDQALNALGNPGLFGVGKKESDLNLFKESKKEILAALQKQFNMKSLEVGHFSESATETESVKNKEWTDVANIKNWIPLLLIVAVIAGVIVTVRKRNRK